MRHRFSTSLAAMLRDKLDVLFARITVALHNVFSLIYFTRATDFAEKEGLLVV